MDGRPIFLNSVDSTIQEELYDRLFEIYNARRIASNYLIADKVLKAEAFNRQISVDSLLKLEIESMIDSQSIRKFIIEKQLEHGFPDASNPTQTIDPYTGYGRLYVSQLMQRELKDKFLANLRKKYNTQVQLQPPLPPRISTEAFIKYPLNESTSPFEVLLLADFECSACKATLPMIFKLIDEYQEEISFSYVHFSNEVNERMIAADCLFSLKGDFREVIATILEQSLESREKGISSTIPIRTKDFEECVLGRTEIHEKLENNIKEIKNQKITRIPSLLIDGRLYYGDFSIQSIKDYIEKVRSFQQ